MIPLNSSAIAAAGYDPRRQILTIQFTSGGVFDYENISPQIYQGLISSRSPGEFFNDHIRIPSEPKAKAKKKKAQPKPTMEWRIPVDSGTMVNGVLEFRTFPESEIGWYPISKPAPGSGQNRKK